jgi:predicted nicotinamide N-methyase
MTRPSSARLRAFVRSETALQAVPGLPSIRLHIADDVMALCHRAGTFMGEPEPDLPFWAFPWAGGMGIAHHLEEHPEEVAGRAVLDLASGSGLCGIVALRQGAASVLAVDPDPLAAAAIWLNAHANGVDLPCLARDLLDDPPPPVEVILAGDVCYQPTMADRILAWLRAASHAGTRVLLGDPGRAYLPDGLQLLSRYEVTTSPELEDADRKVVAIYVLEA